MATKHGWPDRIGSFKRQATVEVASDTWEPFDASMVMYKAGDKWAFFQVFPDGEAGLTLGDAEGAGEFEHDSKKEAIAAVLDWSDFLAEGDF